jgi:hypothetical protein
MKTLGLPEQPEEAGEFDLVVCGGGYAGIGAAISAARMGCKVALIQNRPVLGGNGSSEIRVWAMGGIRRGLYPNIGEIVEEFQDEAKMSPGTYEEFGDAKKEAVVRAERNISLFLNNHIYAVEMTEAKKRIGAVIALDTRTISAGHFAASFSPIAPVMRRSALSPARSSRFVRASISACLICGAGSRRTRRKHSRRRPGPFRSGCRIFPIRSDSTRNGFGKAASTNTRSWNSNRCGTGTYARSSARGMQ